MTTRKYRKSTRFRKTRSKRGGVKTRSGANGIYTKKSSPVKEKDICPICLEVLKKKDNIPNLPCKHKFHKDCLVLVCNGKNNRNVPCPICRGDITNSCISDINPLPPPTHQLSHMSFNDLRNMTAEERRQNQNEFMRDRRNYLARRRRAIARETPQQRDQRVTVEERLERAEREERDRYFHGVSQAHRDQNSRNILLRGLPLPESPPTRPYYPPGSPDYPPPPLTVEDLRTSPSPPRSPPYAPNSPPYPPPGYEPNSPPYAPGSPQYDPNSPPYVSGSPVYSPPPPLTMEDLRTSPSPPGYEPATYSYSNYDEEDEIVRRGRVGDLVDYIPNNQMGFIHYKISLDENGEKYLEAIGDINGYYNGGKKSRKKSRKGLRKTSRKGLRRKSRK